MSSTGETSTNNGTHTNGNGHVTHEGLNGDVVNGLNGHQGSAEAAVTIADGKVLIRDVSIDDRKTVEVIERQADHEAAVRTAIQIGARAIEIADGSLDVKTVEERFDGMSTDLELQITKLTSDVTREAEQAGDAFTKVAEGLLDEEDGSIVASLAAFKEGFLEQVGDLFDQDSKESVISKFEAAVEAVQEEHRSAIEEALASQQKIVSSMLDPHAEDGPIGRLNKSIGAGLKEVADAVQQVRTEITAEKAAAEAAGEVHEKGTQKGVEFEDLIEPEIHRLAGPMNDLVARTSKEKGVEGDKGDFTVTVDPEYVGGGEVRYMIEAKDKDMSGSAPAVRAELAACMRNRSASAGVIVFASEDQAPKMHSTFQCQGNMAWAIYDKETGDDSALRLAIMWARWVASREARQGTEVDPTRIADLIEKGSLSLKTIKSIRTAHTNIKTNVEKQVADADKHVADLEASLRQIFTDLETEISVAETES